MAAKERYINTKFWDDSYIIGLTPTEKLLFIYFITNPLTNIAGVYEISTQRILFDTALTKLRLEKILKKFDTDGKIKYDNGWVVIRNFIKHQKENPKIITGIENELAKVPKQLLKNIGYDSLSRIKIIKNSLSHIDIDIKIDIEKVYKHWNSKEIIIHKKLTAKMKHDIISICKTYDTTTEELISTIDTYALIVLDPKYYFNYKWTLLEFLKRGFEKFRVRNVAMSNHLADHPKNGGVTDTIPFIKDGTPGYL
ncbi:MAG: hypothetical protein O6940_10355 [Ignavibacteria bacterium]|nr:hypothetical protein [Ignavibacteria bacterium]